MIGNEQKLDQLFQQARSQEPKVSYEETRKMFLTSVIAGVGGVLATKGLLKLLTIKKGIIMISAISIITTGAIVATVMSSPSEADNQAVLNEVNYDNEQVEKQIVEAIEAPDKTIEIDGDEIEYESGNSDLVEDIQFEDNRMTDGVLAMASPADNNEPSVIIQKNGVYEPVLVSTKNDIEPYANRFVLTEKTTISELEAFKSSAESAGVSFKYKAKYKKGVITKLYFKMELSSNVDGEEQMQLVMNRSKPVNEFEYVLGWAADDEGNATTLKSGDEEEEASTKESEDMLKEQSEELEELLSTMAADLDKITEEAFDLLENSESMKELEKALDLSAESFDSMIDSVDLDFNQLEAELEGLGDILEEAFKDIEDELDLDPLLKELSEMSSSIVKVVEVEVDKLEKEIERREAEEKE